MDRLLMQTASVADGEDITEQHTVTKTMTPRIGKLTACMVVPSEASVVECDLKQPDAEPPPPPHRTSLTKSPLLHSEDEKCDADPENSRKSCDDVTPDTGDEISLVDNMQLDGAPNNRDGALAAGQPENKTTNQDNNNDAAVSAEMSKSAMAFTIDFTDGKQVDSKKANDIFERFQKRHKRGASMSKLEVCSTSQAQVKLKPPLKKGASTPSKSPFHSNQVSVDTVALIPPNAAVQMRDKSRLSRKDTANADHRHSFSPRNSMQSPAPNANSFQPKSDTLQRAFKSMKESYPLSGRTNSIADLDLVVCDGPPLEFRSSSSPNDEGGSISSVSEAGTYTLDGDNYTEEQKQQMSIDRCSKAFAATSTVVQPQKPKTSYLDRIKSKVKNISDRTFHKKLSPESTLPSKHAHSPPSSPLHHPPNTLDLGSFTSVTSAGVFSKHTIQQQITPIVRAASRKPSLTKSQIDNSEYIQKMDEQMLNSFTDYEKVRHNDYQLNIFSGQLAEDATAVATTATTKSMRTSDSFGIERAETKNDWIQEWAKNARRNTKLKGSQAASGGNAMQLHLQYHDHHPATSSSEFSDVNNVHARMHRRHQVIQRDDSENFTDDMHRFEMHKRNEPPAFQLNRHASAGSRRGSLNAFVQHSSSHSEFGDDLDDNQSTGSSLQPTSLVLDADRMRRNFYQYESCSSSRPPLSPTKIPSPMHTLARPRGSSANRSLHSSITDIHLQNDDTGMYLNKTAAAISQLQTMHRNNNSPQSPSSPQRLQNKIASNFMTSPSVRRHYKTAPFATITNTNTPNESPLPPRYGSSNSLHKRNHSAELSSDTTHSHSNHSSSKRGDPMTNSYNSDGLNAMLHHKFQPHSRHNSYEDPQQPSPVRSSIGKTIDQTFAPTIVQRSHISSPHLAAQRTPVAPLATPSRADSKVRSKSANVTPATIKRSSSFSTKPFVRPMSAAANKSMTPQLDARRRTAAQQSSLHKSASSTSFKSMTQFETDIYLNANDDLYYATSESESSERDPAADDDKELLTNTRYNKAFLARLEQNKQRVAASPAQLKHGVSACPNTPELPRRDMHVRQSLRDRASMPRDSSINRMKQDLSATLSATKKGLTDSPVTTTSRSASTSGGGGSARVLPKYLDISKYKPSQGQSFLKRDESKSTLNAQHKEIKRSNSSFGVGLNKSDAARSSVRSAKSASSTNRTTMATMKDEAAREADLAMWRRRARYDPMKAAAEGKRKMEEKKTTTHASKYNESSSSTAVMRSKSYHSGVGQSAGAAGQMDYGATTNKRWTVISTESSDEEFVEEYYK